MTDSDSDSTASADATGPGSAGHEDAPFLVLARKYRPQTFDELIGQETMVRTLTNAMAGGRIAHAFILTGVRGVGKTTTARIIARALNCTGPDGDGGPTISPCGVCDNCQAIIADRHVDVTEMDAASRTGIEDIREVIDGMKYRPVQARFRVYIIDEVHMLSKPAFNALLKTLEEPPAHVKFIFATTEIRKVPVTVLSRCQRFDLRRVGRERLAAWLGEIAGREAASVDEVALSLLARAADGSVRDGLSLLDQAIVHAGPGATVTGEVVRDMLGLADRAAVVDLFDLLMRGEVAGALDAFAALYQAGADPAVVLGDMLELVHWLTRLVAAPEAASTALLPETERARAGEMAGRLGVPALTRAWQMLLKGLGEVRQASAARAAAEMVLIRLAYAADLPAPADLVRRMTRDESTAPAAREAPVARAEPSAGVADAATADPRPQRPVPGAREATAIDAGPDPAPVAPEAAGERAQPADFPAVVALFETAGEMRLAAELRAYVHVVEFAPGRIAFRPAADAPGDLAARLGAGLGRLCERRWVISIAGDGGGPTLEEDREAVLDTERAAVAEDPLVKAALEIFPAARITGVRRRPGSAGDTGDDEKNTDGTPT